MTYITKRNYKNKYSWQAQVKRQGHQTLIGHRQIFVASMGEGKTVVEKQRKSKAVEEIRKISEQILSELK